MFNNLKGNLGSSGNKTIRRSGNFSEILFRRSFTFIEKKSKQIVQSDVYAVANLQPTVQGHLLVTKRSPIQVRHEWGIIINSILIMSYTLHKYRNVHNNSTYITYLISSQTAEQINVQICGRNFQLPRFTKIKSDSKVLWNFH